MSQLVASPDLASQQQTLRRVMYIWFMALSLAMFCAQVANAQLSAGGSPPGLGFSFKQPTPEFVLPGLNMDSVRIYDRQREAAGLLPAIGRKLERQLSLSDGHWHTLPDGRNVWQLQLRSLGALATSLYFDDFYLPEGGQLFVYSPDGEHVLGAFTSQNNKASGQFATGLMASDVCIVEYIEPKEYPGRVRLSIEAIGHAYRDVPFAKQRRNGFGSSQNCQINVNCDEGTGKADARDAATRILVTQGQVQGWCSGVLVNNTAEDGTPYLLSAEHCALNNQFQLIPQSDIDQWVFYFNYESSNCNDPASEQEVPNNSITGATRIATSDDRGGETGSDMLLLELSARPQNTFNVFYAGWDRTDYGLLNPPPSNGFSIHHPNGDLKKISSFNDQLVSTSFGTNPFLNSHWQVTWTNTSSGHGVTEGGSSGSALFNSNQQVIGTLTGGSSTCANPTSPDEYGKFSYHWASNGTASNRRLSPWLDPGKTGATSLGGKRFAVSSRPSAPGRYAANTIPLIVKVYPNPSSDRFTLEMLPKLATGAIVEVYNTIGGRVNVQVNRTGAAEGKLSVDLAGNAAGLYFIKLRNGNYSTIEKVELMR